MYRHARIGMLCAAGWPQRHTCFIAAIPNAVAHVAVLAFGDPVYTAGQLGKFRGCGGTALFAIGRQHEF